MRVAAMVGVLMFGLMDGFYDIGFYNMTIDVFEGSTAETEQVRSFEDNYPPPPSFP